MDKLLKNASICSSAEEFRKRFPDDYKMLPYEDIKRYFDSRQFDDLIGKTDESGTTHLTDEEFEKALSEKIKELGVKTVTAFPKTRIINSLYDKMRIEVAYGDIVIPKTPLIIIRGFPKHQRDNIAKYLSYIHDYHNYSHVWENRHSIYSKTLTNIRLKRRTVITGSFVKIEDMGIYLKLNCAKTVLKVLWEDGKETRGANHWEDYKHEITGVQRDSHRR